ncbi:MAG: asparagine synthetase A [Candidatus Aenigmatarchaeota archaeon]|jgi:asparaginyl-tRNA synthetase
MKGDLKAAISHLRRKELPIILKIQTTVLKEMEDFMIKKGFVQLMPLITSKFTDPLAPDPQAALLKSVSFEYFGQKLVLTQSMLLHKQLALLTGCDKIFIFSPNVRLEKYEKISTGRHLIEFTQMDFEVAYASMEDIMRLTEELIIKIFRKVKKTHSKELKILGRKLEIPKRPFKVYTSHELEEKFGKNWEIKASKEEKYPFWVICHKREFYDREDSENPGHFRNYDLIYPEGYGEALSGGEREWEYEKLKKKIKNDKLKAKIYKDFLAVAKEGLLKPSAGAGIGVERLVRFLTGRKHIIEVQPFIRAPGMKIII